MIIHFTLAITYPIGGHDFHIQTKGKQGSACSKRNGGKLYDLDRNEPVKDDPKTW